MDETIELIYKQVKQNNLRMFLADEGTFGFVTDKEGTRVITFWNNTFDDGYIFAIAIRPSPEHGSGFCVRGEKNLFNNEKQVLEFKKWFEMPLSIPPRTLKEFIKDKNWYTEVKD